MKLPDSRVGSRENIDLNLLVIFDAIMTGSSISGAAERLSTTQPAVSNAVSECGLSGMIHCLKKDGRGSKTYAFNLWKQTNAALIANLRRLKPAEFDQPRRVGVFNCLR